MILLLNTRRLLLKKMNVNNMLKKFKRKFKEIGEDSEEVEEIRRKKPKNLTVEDITPLPDVTVIYSNETASKGVVKNVKNFNFIKSNVSNYVVNPFYKRKKFDDDHHNLNHNNNNNNYCKVDDMNGGHQFLQGREIREKKKYNTRYQVSTVKKKNFGVKNLNPVVLLHRIVMPEPEPPAAAIESFEKIFDRTKFIGKKIEENLRKFSGKITITCAIFVPVNLVLEVRSNFTCVGISNFYFSS
ncbi:uncharacterized protein LOC141529656 isoform X2 [Cotesia typhae]|uniref:uncharacterized protein LOC141529656 isoform X2 n=1 Tax=Cotesia typhae TaxID=2053667 RepID=UPI003D69CAAA